MRRELRAVIQEAHPEIEVTAESESHLALKLAGGETGTLFLANVYSGLAQALNDPAVRREAMRAFVESALSQQAEAGQPLSMAAHGSRLMPRLQPEDFLASGDAKDPLVRAPSGIPGLVTVFVLDGESSVMYLTESRLGELEIDAGGLREHAFRNLLRVTPEQPIRSAVEGGALVMLKAGDSFDATRLLLVPQMLRPGEELAAFIPDRETLGLLAVPVDGDWKGIRKLARTPASPYALLDRPLRVRSDGFEIV